MPDLFISYSREDQAIARRFAEGFEREGLSVWWDQALNPGEAFDQVTEEALAAARAVVVLWSKTSVSSRWVRAEATQASAANRLLPVMIEPCTRPIMFELTHTADLTQWQGHRDEAAWQAFVASVRRFVERRAGEDGAGIPTSPAGPPSAPTLRERAAAGRAALRAAVLRAGSLLRRYRSQLIVGVLAATLAAGLATKLQPRPAAAVARFTIDVPGTPGSGLGLALSPDGQRIVYAANEQLYARRLDRDQVMPIPGSGGAGNPRAVAPFFSPDGRSVAFFTPTELKVFDFDSEVTRVLAPVDPLGTSGVWDDHGRIFYGQFSVGLKVVAAAGGEPRDFAPLGEHAGIGYPGVLPGGDWVLFSARTGDVNQANWNSADILAQHVRTGERKLILRGGWFPRYLPTGHLVFLRSGTLHAVAFDAKRLERRGDPVSVVPGIIPDSTGNAYQPGVAISANGTLVHGGPAPLLQGGSPSGPETTRFPLLRIGAGGTRQLAAEPRDYGSLSASPDGSLIAVEVGAGAAGGGTQIWVVDAATGVANPLTFEGDNTFPVWTADGRDILYTSRHGDRYAIQRQAANGSGLARHVLDGGPGLVATDVHGSTLVFHDGDAGQRDLLTFDLDGNGPLQPLLATAADEFGAKVSPDGRWVAYMAIATGSGFPGVYVRPFPNAPAGAPRAISEVGTVGANPMWSAAGDEIHYASFNPAIGETAAIWSATLALSPSSVTPTQRRRLFDLSRFGPPRGRYGAALAHLAGGEFVGVASGAASDAGAAERSADPRLTVVLNWFEELRQRVPVE